MTDIIKLNRDEYQRLTKELETKQAEIEQIKAKLEPLKAFLKTAGILETKTRKRKAAEPNPAA